MPRTTLRLIAAAAVSLAVAAAAEERPTSDASTIATSDPETTSENETTTSTSRRTATASPASGPRMPELVVEAQKPLSAASSDEIRARDFDLRPHDTMMQILNNIPGLVVSQHQGGGKAPQWL